MIARGIKDELIRVLKRMNPDIELRDCLVFGGIAATAYGISMIYPPAAWIFSGLALFWLGVR
ncbi:MAG: hypothetical protein V1784_03140 [bacterium]